MQSLVSVGKESEMTDYMIRLSDGSKIVVFEEKNNLKAEADEYRMKQYSEYLRKKRPEMEASHG